MSLGIREVLLAFHIFLAIIWVGGILFVGWGVMPVIKTIALAARRKFMITMMKRTHWMFSLVGAGVISTGILLGTVFGPIRQWNHVWNTGYGRLWSSALIIGLATLFWGIFIGYRQMMRVLTDDSLWLLAENGERRPLKVAIFRASAIESIEVIGFMALIIIMVKL